MASGNFFAVVPAAGLSRRMGRPKLLLPWRGRTVVEHLFEAWRAGGVERIVVVVRRDDAALIELCLAAAVELVTPDVDPPDMKWSVRHALARIRERWSPSNADAWLLAPADQPRLSPTVIRTLVAAHCQRHAGDAILVPTWRERRGHPVLFPWSLAAEVDELPEDSGVNRLLKTHQVVELAVDDDAIVEDLDTPDDYRRLVK